MSARTISRLAVFTLTLLFSACEAADAKTLYVNGTTGNDSTSYAANGPASPWRTIGRAAWGSVNRDAPNAREAAQAGDVVRIVAGTYSTAATNYRFGPAYNPVNSGAENRPIRFEATGPVQLTFTSGTGPMIGADNKNYIEWSGFNIDEATAPTRSDTGPVVFATARGGSVENCTLVGNPNWQSRVGDNYDGIRIHGSSGQRIYNNRIVGFGGLTGDENHNGIETYWASDLLVENNEFENNGAGIYLKGNSPENMVVGRLTIRFNRFLKNNDGIRVLRIPNTAAEPTTISQNVFVNNEMALTIQVFDRGVTDPRHVKAVNNTFVDNTWALYVGGAGGLVDHAGHIFWNNIIAGGTWAIMYTHPAANLRKSQVDLEHNVYFGSTSHSEVAGRGYSFPDWLSTFKQDTAPPRSLNQDPHFADRKSQDYRLRDSSPARATGADVLDLDQDGNREELIPAGAYVSGKEVIGRRPPQ